MKTYVSNLRLNVNPLLIDLRAEFDLALFPNGNTVPCQLWNAPGGLLIIMDRSRLNDCLRVRGNPYPPAFAKAWLAFFNECHPGEDLTCLAKARKATIYQEFNEALTAKLFADHPNIFKDLSF